MRCQATKTRHNPAEGSCNYTTIRCVGFATVNTVDHEGNTGTVCSSCAYDIEIGDRRTTIYVEA